MKTRVGDIEIQYELSGRAYPPVVVLSHSLGATMSMWDPQMGELKEFYRTLRYDTRGHGGSGAPKGPYTLDQLGDDVVGLMDTLDIGEVHFVGLSLGGMIGQNLALRFPERLRSLVLCDTAARLPEEAVPVWQDRMATARRQGMEAMVQPTLERWFTPAFLEQPPPVLEPIRSRFLSNPVDGYIGCAQAILGLDYLDQLEEIQTPALIIVGEEDPATPPEAAQAMQERISGSQLAVLPEAAHLSNVEQADAFNRTLIRFLKEH